MLERDSSYVESFGDPCYYDYMIDIQWMIGGEAGYGIMTTGVMMSKIFTRLGLSVFDYVEYPSLIRGGHNAYYVRGSDEAIYSQKKTVDILVALNHETIEKHKDELISQSVILYDSNSIKLKNEFSSDIFTIPIPLLEMMKDLQIDHLMINTITIGASLALFYDDFSLLQKIMQDTFIKKGEEVVAINTKTSKAGFDFIKEKYNGIFKKRFSLNKQTSLLMSGADAVALGAIRAGLKFAAIYPMTPINSILTKLTQHALSYNIIVKEPEDEIAGINMAIGASFAGVRSMVATSGGGFSLMVESVGLAAQTETPLVIVMGMRPGPATGMPTWTEQGDLRFVMHAAQGDFPRIILTPGDIGECFSLTLRAFNLAEKYQLPVVVLVDKYLMEGHATVNIDKLRLENAWYRIDRGKIVSSAQLKGIRDFKRYILTNDGISPRSFPGQEGGISFSGSDEHDERGLYNEEADVREAMMEKRFKKLKTLETEILVPQIYGSKNAKITLIEFGSTKLPCLEAVKCLKHEGININVIHFSWVHPFPSKHFIQLVKKSKKTIVVEGNYSGQFEGILRERTGFVPDDRLRKYNGRPFYPEEIIAKIKEII